MEDGDVQDVVSVGGYQQRSNNGQESGFGPKINKKKSTEVAFYCVLSCFLECTIGNSNPGPTD